MKKMVMILLAAAVLLAGIPAVHADQQEWNPEELAALDAWVCTQSDLDALIAVYGSIPLTQCCWSQEVTRRLFAEPGTFMRALSKAEPQKQQAIVKTITSDIYFGLNPGIQEFPGLVDSVILEEADTPETRQVLRLFQNAVAEYWGTPNPKTGDPVGIVMTAMGICSLICALMILFHKKEG